MGVVACEEICVVACEKVFTEAALPLLEAVGGIETVVASAVLLPVMVEDVCGRDDSLLISVEVLGAVVLSLVVLSVDDDVDAFGVLETLEDEVIVEDGGRGVVVTAVCVCVVVNRGGTDICDAEEVADEVENGTVSVSVMYDPHPVPSHTHITVRMTVPVTVTADSIAAQSVRLSTMVPREPYRIPLPGWRGALVQTMLGAM